MTRSARSLHSLAIRNENGVSRASSFFYCVTVRDVIPCLLRYSKRRNTLLSVLQKETLYLVYCVTVRDVIPCLLCYRKRRYTLLY